MCHIHLNRFILSHLRKENSKFGSIFDFNDLQWCQLAASGQSWIRCTTINLFLYPMLSKSFRSLKGLMTISRSQTSSFKSVTDQQTNKQTNKYPTFLPGCVRSPGPSKLGRLIEEVCTILHFENVLYSTCSFAARGDESLVKTNSPRRNPWANTINLRLQWMCKCRQALKI